MKFKSLALALTLAIVSSFSGNVLPAEAATGNDTVDLTHELDVEELSPTELVITNPNTEGFTVVPEEDTTSLSSFIVPSISDTVYNGCEEATSAIRAMMASRVCSFSVSCYSDSSSGAFDMRDYLQAHLFDETASSKEGDYLYWNLHKYNIQFDIAKAGEKYIVTSEMEVEYLSNAAQEQEIDNIVATALSSKGAVGSQGAKNKYEQVKAIYKFICDDFDYVMDDANHSTYSALGRHQTVCQGYATSLYRLCRDSGISSRVIASQTHGWNIVQLGSLYYLCDATWEDTDNIDGYNEYFLKGSSTFPSDEILATSTDASIENVETLELGDDKFLNYFYDNSYVPVKLSVKTILQGNSAKEQLVSLSDNNRQKLADNLIYIEYEITNFSSERIIIENKFYDADLAESIFYKDAKEFTGVSNSCYLNAGETILMKCVVVHNHDDLVWYDFKASSLIKLDYKK